ncbi:gp436 family protein [Aeromonas piscicola]|uniref:gp436 family protein n=1 Tax=Aeromonas piscicola TaxID=600645 RepID=UPI0005B4B423|nr:phage protein Gp36 family protein [Aeromonas piscicola]
MRYATPTDLDERYGATLITRLSDKDNTGERADAAIARALEDADVVIDGFLDGRYPLPLATVPRVLVRLSTSLARYHLEEGCATDRVNDDYTLALKMLEKIGKGELSLGLSTEGARPEPGMSCEITSGGHVFARQDSQGFI